jgi:carbon-monoxide dehydrogenase catalytic subunit
MMTAQISIHEGIKQMHQRLKEAGLSSVAERFQQQERMRCKPRGVAAKLAAGRQAPHRVVPGKAERGACGTDAAGDDDAQSYLP